MDEDQHYCLKCHKLIAGLANYVQHFTVCSHQAQRDQLSDPLPCASIDGIDDPFAIEFERFVNEVEISNENNIINDDDELPVQQLTQQLGPDHVDHVDHDLPAPTNHKHDNIQPIEILNIQLKTHFTSFCDRCSYYPPRNSNVLIKHALTTGHRCAYEYDSDWHADLLKLQTEIATTFPFICELCSFYATRLSSFAWHLNSAGHKNQTELSKTICSKCGIVLKSMSAILEHHRKEVNHARDKVFYGNLILCTFDKSRVIADRDSPEKKCSRFKCKTCRRTFRTRFQLNVHANEHLAITTSSSKTSSSSRRKTSFSRHLQPQESKLPSFAIEESRGNVDVAPAVVSQTSIAPTNANDVKLVKVDNKFHCTYANCTRSFARKCQLEVHISAHSTEKPFKCSQCTYASKFPNKLHQHEKTHSRSARTSFKCNQCPFKTNSKPNLDVHIRKHTGSRPFQCPHCTYSCSTSGNLRKHMLKSSKHQDLSMYPCSECTYSSNFFTEFLNHLRAKHSNKFKEEDIRLLTQKNIFDRLRAEKSSS